ncbi:P-loop containing nucleoside triphosphate hydrolase protein [Byssothecium circinans]|uniref:RNA helicase n=1 Tax=Byssothecium circinans TaxID=147558 RepID=A0A6A5TXV4_9PLEO|nr:P-loop containing nucleoside triphosphate hydrolase protein [Byssothecium circinans]
MRPVLLAPLRLRTRYLPYIPRAYALHRLQFRNHYAGLSAEARGDGIPPHLFSLDAKATPKAIPKAKHGAPPPTKKRKAENRKMREADQARKAKNKAHTDASSGAGEEPSMTAQAIREQFELPIRGQYSNAPNKLWDFLENDPRDINLNWLNKKLFPEKLLFKSTKTFMRDRNCSEARKAPFRFQIVAATYHGQTFTAVGDGASKLQAYKSCALHLIAQLHHTGILTELFGRPTIPVLKQDIGGPTPRIAAYEFASSFLLVPRFTTIPITPEILAKARVQGNVKPSQQCTVDLPELGISIVGVGSSHAQAEAAAVQRLMELATSLEHGSAPDLPITQGKALRVSDMESFLNFWDHSKGVLLTRSNQIERSGRGNKLVYETQATLGGNPIGEPVLTPNQSDGENLAILTAAVALGKKDPSLLSSFQSALQEAGGKILRMLRPVEIRMSNEVLNAMGGVIYQQRGTRKSSSPIPVETASNDSTTARRVRKSTDHATRNTALQSAFAAYQASPATETMRQKREELPINHYRTEILDMVSESPFSVVVGSTGSGKTTQVPQMFLEAAARAGEGASCNVICTQPRRIAATSVARRVADERAENLSESVGYIVRHNSAPPREDGSILFCTSGILLQQLQHDPDAVFDTTSHILLDEVHERDITLDFLLVVLKKALKQRVAANKSVPRVVLMSATMNTELFSKYFGSQDASGKLIPCPSITVPGRLFPVRNQYLHEIHNELQRNYSGRALNELLNEKDTAKYLKKELEPTDVRSSHIRTQDEVFLDEGAFDPDDALTPVGLAVATVAHVAKTTNNGAILVFLPGQSEIQTAQRLLERKPIFGVDFTDSSRYKLFILHSTTSPEDQASVFNPVPEGCRKVILSTNIAETSVTIPDVQYVIDSGKHRENRYDSVNRITALQSTWISQANAKQRAGRAGRVQNGNYYGLYSEERLAQLKITGQAEMLRADLQEVCLDVKAHGFSDSIGNFLSQALEPPSPSNVQSAVKTLQSLEALTEEEQLSPLGELLAALPVQPALGKMIVLGIIFRCLDPLIILGALSSARSLFLKPSGLRSEWEASHIEWLNGTQSEHMAQVNAYNRIRQYEQEVGHHAAFQFAQENFISMKAYDQTRRAAQDIEEILIKSQLIPRAQRSQRHQHYFGDQALNVNSENVPLLKALALVGFAPNLAIHTHSRWFRTRTADHVQVHPKSTIAGSKDAVSYNGAMVTFSTLFNSDPSSLTMREVTEVPHATSLLFGGKLKVKGGRVGNQLSELDDWLPLRLGEDTHLVHQFRRTLDSFLSNAFRDLTSHRLRNANASNGEKKYFADDTARAAFARGLVNVIDLLDHQSKIVVGTAPRWANTWRSGGIVSFAQAGKTAQNVDRRGSGHFNKTLAQVMGEAGSEKGSEKKKEGSGRKRPVFKF